MKIQYTIKFYPELGKTELIPSGGLCWAVKVTREHSHQVFCEDCFKTAGVYLLLADTDEGRQEVYVGESHIVKGRFASHQGKNPPVKWTEAIIFLNNTITPWSKNEINNIQLGLYDQLSQVNRFRMPSNTQQPRRWVVPNQDLIDRLVEEMMGMVPFLGYPKLFEPVKISEKALSLAEKNDAAKEDKAIEVPAPISEGGGNVKHPAPSFTFAMAHVPEHAELIFTEGGQKVIAKGKNQVAYGGETYSLTGFVKKYMPQSKRNKKDAYQGPAFFTYKGDLLTVLRKKYETMKPKAVVEKVPRKEKEVCASGLTKTQLAKKIATLIDGRDGAFGGILQYFSKFKSCPKTGKWRKPLTDVGVKFDKEDFVVDWRVAKI